MIPAATLALVDDLGGVRPGQVLIALHVAGRIAYIGVTGDR